MILECRRDSRVAVAVPIEMGAVRTLTRDICMGGVSLRDSPPLAIGMPVEFFMDLRSVGDRGTRLRCRGVVLRAENSGTGVGVTIDDFEIEPMEEPPA